MSIDENDGHFENALCIGVGSEPDSNVTVEIEVPSEKQRVQ
jgi:hypothetical protein